MILLEDDEIKRVLLSVGFLVDYCENLTKEELVWWRGVAQTQAEKIALKLKEIYGIPDLKMEHDRMGEFIQEIMEEIEL